MDVAAQGDFMKRMIVGLAAVTLCAVFFIPGCSDAGKARVDVAKKKLLDQIDDALGKMDVQKAEIDNGIKSAKLAADGVRKAKIKAQVSLEQLDEKVKQYQEKIAN